MRNAPKVVREVGVHDFQMATEQQLLHLDDRLLGIFSDAGASRAVDPVKSRRRKPPKKEPAGKR